MTRMEYQDMSAGYTPGSVTDDYGTSICPACGDRIDYCQGHGVIGDPRGRAILDRHDSGDHEHCHPTARCES